MTQTEFCSGSWSSTPHRGGMGWSENKMRSSCGVPLVSELTVVSSCTRHHCRYTSKHSTGRKCTRQTKGAMSERASVCVGGTGIHVNSRRFEERKRLPRSTARLLLLNSGEVLHEPRHTQTAYKAKSAHKDSHMGDAVARNQAQCWSSSTRLAGSTSNCSFVFHRHLAPFSCR